MCRAAERRTQRGDLLVGVLILGVLCYAGCAAPTDEFESVDRTIARGDAPSGEPEDADLVADAEQLAMDGGYVLRCRAEATYRGARWSYRTAWFQPERRNEGVVDVLRDDAFQGRLRLPRGPTRGAFATPGPQLRWTLAVRRDEGNDLLPAVELEHHLPGGHLVRPTRANTGCDARAVPACGRYAIPVCEGESLDAEPACRCLESGAAPPDPFGNALIGAFSGVGARLLLTTLAGRSAQLLTTSVAALGGSLVKAGLIVALDNALEYHPRTRVAVDHLVRLELDAFQDSVVELLAEASHAERRMLRLDPVSLGIAGPIRLRELLELTRRTGRVAGLEVGGEVWIAPRGEALPTDGAFVATTTTGTSQTQMQLEQKHEDVIVVQSFGPILRRHPGLLVHVSDLGEWVERTER